MSRHLFWPPIVVAFLLATPSTSTYGQGRGTPATLPDGPGKDIAQMSCTKCHALNLIANSGYSRAEWQSVFNTMVDLPADQTSTLADYLAKNFPDKPRPPAVLVPGSAKVSFKEWALPTKHTHPYDVVTDKNGEAWTGGMSTDRINRLNPRTGQVVEYPLPRDTNMRRAFVDNSTNPPTFWVGSNHGASIVKVEPLD